MSKNIILLTMSTINRQPELNYYVYKNAGNYYLYKGKSQLEPGTKHILNLLSQDNCQIDKIFVLSSPETLKNNNESNMFIPPQEELEELTNSKALINGKICATDYFIWRIKGYLHDKGRELNSQDFETLINESFKGINKENIILPNETVADKYNDKFDNLFEVIAIPSNEEDLPVDKVPELVRKILDVKEEENEVINIFQNIQGGARTASFIINSTLNMLQSRNVSVKAAYSCAYKPGNKIHPIRNEIMANRTLELVSGMDEFINYGKAKKFKHYYEYYKNLNGNLDKVPEDDVINRIEAVANSISLCQMDSFIKEVKELKLSIDKYKESKQKKDNLFLAFIDNIENQYRIIWESKYNAITIIEWCVEREWYQQALTVVESKMPKQMVDDGIIIYSTNNTKTQRIQDLQDIVFKKHFQNGQFKDKYKFKDVSHYYIKDYWKDLDYTNATKGFQYLFDNGIFVTNYSGDTNQIFQIVEKYIALSDERNSIAHGTEIDKTLSQIIYDINDFVNEYNMLNKLKGLDIIVREEISCDEVFQDIKKKAKGCKTVSKNGGKKTKKKEKEKKQLTVNSIVQSKTKKFRLEGVLSDGSKAMIPASQFNNDINLNDQVGKTFEVIIVDKNQNPKRCELVK